MAVRQRRVNRRRVSDKQGSINMRVESDETSPDGADDHVEYVSQNGSTAEEIRRWKSWREQLLSNPRTSLPGRVAIVRMPIDDFS